MNSGLQCLSHTKELTDYFLSLEYKRHINKSNPLGASGSIANAYANLLKNLWNETSPVFSPWNFKKTISKFVPQFSGYS